jgi:serine phosphatase RsbU (regulator of sigma subunit)
VSRLQRIALLAIPAILLPVVFVYDVVRSAVEFEVTSLTTIREFGVVVSFIAIGLFIRNRRKSVNRNAPKEIGRLFFAVFFGILVIALSTFIQPTSVPERSAPNIHLSALSMLATSGQSLLLGIVSIYLLFIIHDLVLFKRRKSTRRYYIAYFVLLFISCAMELPFIRFENGLLSSIFFSLTIVLIIINSFRQNWIVYLSKREKGYSIIYSVLLFFALVVLDIYLAQRTGTNNLLKSYSSTLHTFIWLNSIFGTIYFGVTFISTLFHLPTAEVFERKQSELNSLHNLSRLVTQVFDFNDLLNTVTQMTMEVCGARSVWLELYTVNEDSGEMSVAVAAKKNISQEEIDLIISDGGNQLRHYFIDTKKVLLIDDIWSDRRTKFLKDKGFTRGSLLTVPLLSHGKLIGVLHATKEFQNAFDQDDIDVMTTFADHVSIAIENSRLIAKSIERERFHQEMMVAQRMQKRLLPQKLPKLPQVEFAVVSESSMEVGGDYYDVLILSDDRIGIVVGDVSGKGVSAAFYMAEVKGIVLSLSKICSTPSELLLRANDSLLESLEKSAFISAIYGVLDIQDASLTLARAGHCPAIFVSEETVELVRPNGVGLGLTNDLNFKKATEERVLRLKPGDICIFYTDGVTEARNAQMEEYGYERLVKVVQECRNCSAERMKENILQSVQTFIGSGAYTDDITLIVVKWLGNS